MLQTIKVSTIHVRVCAHALRIARLYYMLPYYEISGVKTDSGSDASYCLKGILKKCLETRSKIKNYVL
jgi:hypothetical protein